MIDAHVDVERVEAVPYGPELPPEQQVSYATDDENPLLQTAKR
jgi:hypothetical protein